MPTTKNKGLPAGRKRGRKILPAFLGLCLLAAGSCSPEKPASEDTALPDVEFCDGDLVFRYGNGVFSSYFRDFAGKGNPYSHVGVVVLDKGKSVRVVHAQASELSGIGRVRAEPAEDFLKGVSVWGLYRLRASPERRDRVAGAAMDFARREVPFDPDFDLGDSTAVYCTELVMRAVNAGCDSTVILPRTFRYGRLFVSLDDLTDNPALENVYRSF